MNLNNCALYVTEGTELIGSIKTVGDIFIDGNVKGEITSNGKTIIERDSSVFADIQCKSLTVNGEINGNLDIEDSISIKSNGKIVGDIACGELLIDEGAVYLGEVSIDKKS